MYRSNKNMIKEMLPLVVCNLCFKLDTVTKRLEVTPNYD